MKLRVRRPHHSEQIVVEQSIGQHDHKLKKALFSLSPRAIMNEADLLQMYRELTFAGRGEEEYKFNTWNRYKDIRSAFYILQPSKLWPGYYVCSCYDGRKKRLCKHIVMLMCSKGILTYPPGANDRVLQRRRAGGRPKLAAKALVRE
jgi:hypothetical protein